MSTFTHQLANPKSYFQVFSNDSVPIVSFKKTGKPPHQSAEASTPENPRASKRISGPNQIYFGPNQHSSNYYERIQSD